MPRGRGMSPGAATATENAYPAGAAGNARRGSRRLGAWTRPLIKAAFHPNDAAMWDESGAPGPGGAVRPTTS
jgi:hypothetical protein